jgi:hypothetical protein
MKDRYPGIIVPALPEKSPFAKLNKSIVDSVTSEFLENRRYSL